MRTTTADRYVSRSRFSASDRPIHPDLKVGAALGKRRTGRTARDMSAAWSARLARRLESFAARLAGVRRSASLALALLLSTGAGRRPDQAVQGARS